MWPDRVSNPGPLALESDALPTAPRGPAIIIIIIIIIWSIISILLLLIIIIINNGVR